MGSTPKRGLGCPVRFLEMIHAAVCGGLCQFRRESSKSMDSLDCLYCRKERAALEKMQSTMDNGARERMKKGHYYSIVSYPNRVE
jgi:hypothetical protein